MQREATLLLGREGGTSRSFGFLRTETTVPNRPVEFDGFSHLTTVAPTGAGKGRSVIIPNLLHYPGPVVVTDIKGELYQVTARRRREMGHRVIRLDPFGLLGPDGDGLNPLDAFRLTHADVESEAQALAEMLSLGNKGTKDPFWDLNAGGLLSGLIAHVATGEPSEKRNMNRVRQLLHGDDVIYALATMMDTRGKTMNRMAYDEIAAFLQAAERDTRPSILSTAVSYLKPFGSPGVAKSLERSTFSMEEVVAGKPLSVYLILPPDKIQSHRGLLKLWIGTLLKAITSRTEIPAQRTLMLLDECGQLESFPFLETVITLCRGYGVTCWTFWQDLDQIKGHYPKSWKTILNNSGVLQTFGMNNREMASQWGEYLPMSPDELMGLGPEEQVLMLAGRGMRRCQRMDYLRDKLFDGLFDTNRFYGGAPAPEKAYEPALGMLFSGA